MDNGIPSVEKNDRVTLVAYTMFMQETAAGASGYIPQDVHSGLTALEDSIDWLNDLPLPEEVDQEIDRLYSLLPKGLDELAEFAGRNCYQAWNRPNPATASNDGYLKNILSQEHYSVLEHGSATFFLKGVSTAFLGRLTRHRHLSFSVLSKRYVDESAAGYVVHPGLGDDYLSEVDDAFGVISLDDLIDEVHDAATTAYSRIVEHLVQKGYERKQAREIARGVLPQATETRIVVTGNMRAWRDVLKKRNTPYADKEDQEIAKLILSDLKKIAPNSFQDLEV